MSKTLRWVASTKGGGEGRERKEWRGSEGERKGEREKESLLKKIGNQIIEMAQSTLTDDSINKMYLQTEYYSAATSNKMLINTAT